MEARFQIIWIYLLLLIRALTIHKTSKYLGVHFDKKSGKWKVQVFLKGKRLALGSYSSEKEAAIAHDQAVCFFFPDTKDKFQRC